MDTEERTTSTSTTATATTATTTGVIREKRERNEKEGGPVPPRKRARSVSPEQEKEEEERERAGVYDSDTDDDAEYEEIHELAERIREKKKLMKNDQKDNNTKKPIVPRTAEPKAREPACFSRPTLAPSTTPQQLASLSPSSPSSA